MKQWINGLVALGPFVFALPGLAQAGPIEDGRAAFQLGDYATAMRLWRPLAEQGNADAETLIGSLYMFGQGVPQDYGQSAIWLAKAGEQGQASAQLGLCELYDSGEGVPQNYILAHMWCNLAASRVSGKDHGLYVFERDKVAAKMTPDQIAEAQRMAREWKPK